MSIKQERQDPTEQERLEEYVRHLRAIREHYGSNMSEEDKKACREALGGLYRVDRERAWRQAGKAFNCRDGVEAAVRELREGQPLLSLPAVVDDLVHDYILKLVGALESLAKVKLESPLGFFRQCMWNCIAAKLSKETAKFRVTDKTMISLRDAGVPESVLSKLEPMKKWKKLSRMQFENEATKLLGGEWAAVHTLVLQHAEQRAVKECPTSYKEPDDKTVGVTPEPPARADSDPAIQMMSQETEQNILRALNQLTGREGEVMRLLQDGLPSGEVARRLNVSKNAVHVARCNGRRKLRNKLYPPEKQEG